MFLRGLLLRYMIFYQSKLLDLYFHLRQKVKFKFAFRIIKGLDSLFKLYREADNLF